MPSNPNSTTATANEGAIAISTITAPVEANPRISMRPFLTCATNRGRTALPSTAPEAIAASEIPNCTAPAAGAAWEAPGDPNGPIRRVDEGVPARELTVIEECRHEGDARGVENGGAEPGGEHCGEHHSQRRVNRDQERHHRENDRAQDVAP